MYFPLFVSLHLEHLGLFKIIAFLQFRVWFCQLLRYDGSVLEESRTVLSLKIQSKAPRHNLCHEYCFSILFYLVIFFNDLNAFSSWTEAEVLLDLCCKSPHLPPYTTPPHPTPPPRDALQEKQLLT